MMENKELPNGWAWATVSDLAEVGTGTTPSRDVVAYWKEGSIPWITSSAVNQFSVTEANEKVTSAAIRDTTLRLYPKHTLLLALYGEGKTRGKVSELLIDATINQALAAIQLRESATECRAYLKSFLQSHYDALRRQAVGGMQPNLNLSIVKRIRIPVAPLAEQHRIVEKVEELLSELDVGVAALKRARGNLKKYRAAVLKAAVCGELTADWRASHLNVEPATALLDRILNERRRKWEADQQAKYSASNRALPKRWKHKYSEPDSPEPKEPSKLPFGWVWAKTAQLGDIQLGRQRSPKNRSDKNPTKYIRAANITEQGLALDDLLDMEFSPAEQITYRLRAGDIVLSEASGSPDQVGKPAVWNDEIPNCCFQNTVIRLRPEQVRSKFLLVVFQHLYLNKVLAKVAGGVGINHLSAAKFSALVVSLAPEAEQDAIVSEVEQRLSVISATEEYIDAGLKRASRLRQSILKEAFTGQLVPQNPVEESASELLLRIRQQSKASLSPSRSRQLRRPVRRREPNGIIFHRGAIASYIVRRLSANQSFGRTQLVKALHLAQAHVRVDLALEFKRHQLGPLDEAIYKLEGFARKRGWFIGNERETKGVSYQGGPNIDERCEAALNILGENQREMDRLLTDLLPLDTDAAELFSTIYAAWNDLLIDGRSADDIGIVAEVYAWHESKKKFPRSSILSRIVWMRNNGYVPTGSGSRTQTLSNKDGESGS
ncbi:Type-1 restriction enzyme EcoKI specificity protein [Gemmata sp. SH-PL17]|uniref:restriction endonuclease subunit S n=1 Tax=Gemmata sp. SH-PL17 TaxID=1630693 RepID=UPI00078EC032|nr:restriction endonuclease subunit S [Gemmata sp. SH-PL17]AMV29402.1 Type-1 restriction enzyme EcoKI specificity protein [Gemmata sp. SH-PL17]